MSYYRTVKGRKYDKHLLELAEEFVSGKGDGRISLADAKKLITAVKDGNDYTDIEKRTVEYIRTNFSFTDSADSWFRTEIRKWAASKPASRSSEGKKENKTAGKKKSADQGYYRTIKGKKYDRKILDMADKFVSGKGDGRISLADAKKLLGAVTDGNDYTDTEKKTIEYIRNNYSFTESSDAWFRTEIRKWAAKRTAGAASKTGAKKKGKSISKKKGVK